MKHGNLIISSDGKAYSDTIKNHTLRRFIGSPSGRSRLAAAAMINPIRTCLDYSGIARKCFQIEPLPQGALQVYDRNINVASVIAKSGFRHDKLFISSRGKASKNRFYRSQGHHPNF